ncbi:DUF934 domain-containing protein [Aristophania vespae]|uniref:DUF934 domain-containing protein n=1 Tax=Aristophania vespae TaxID=2697033 RepID=UPI0023511EF2|nr:DUF934 domain-containing protein [Aristophania vespae]UMM64127.1 hypothetical protein DM15PD_11180 [Aristophania vespae]
MQLFNLGSRKAHIYDQVVSVAELAENHGAEAVLLKPEESAEIIRPFIGQLKLILLQFPSFKDGRAFTQARTLREYLGYKEEIRVEGHILPDQAEFLKRCGVDNVVLSSDADPAIWQERLKRFSFSYQSLLKGH